MSNFLARFFQRKPSLIVSQLVFNQNCFCGAAFSAQVPVIYNVRTEDTTFLADYDAARDAWHSGHFHQANPQMTAILDFDEQVDAAAPEALVNTGIGFRLPRAT